MPTPQNFFAMAEFVPPKNKKQKLMKELAEAKAADDALVYDSISTLLIQFQSREGLVSVRVSSMFLFERS